MAETSGSHGWLNRRWYGSPGILLLLWPLEILFRLLIIQRRFFYSIGLFSSWRAPVPVIVVGNVVVGGVGKTPLVIALVEYLKSQGYRPGVVSRGYGGKPQLGLQTVSADSLASEVGDEPLLIASRTGCPCVVGSNRANAVRKLLAESVCDLVISDDGLQHYSLERDLELVVVDKHRQYGNGHCLPVGPLREPLSRLSSVDFIISNGGSEYHSIKIVPAQWINLLTGEQLDKLPASAGGRTDHAVCGIGNPQGFYSTLSDLGLDYQIHSFADHHLFHLEDFDFARGGRLLMTEKDAVKCRDFATGNMWYLSVDAVVSAAMYADLSARLNEIFKK